MLQVFAQAAACDHYDHQGPLLPSLRHAFEQCTPATLESPAWDDSVVASCQAAVAQADQVNDRESGGVTTGCTLWWHVPCWVLHDACTA
jgi:hypothetical protein